MIEAMFIIQRLHNTCHIHRSVLKLIMHGTESRYTESGVRRFVQGNKDPAKMTHTIMALIKRVLGAKCIQTIYIQ